MIIKFEYNVLRNIVKSKGPEKNGEKGLTGNRNEYVVTLLRKNQKKFDVAPQCNGAFPLSN